MNKKALMVIEIIWIILGLGIAIREIVTNGFGRAWLFLVMSAVAFLLAGVRDRQRKKT
jgi:membrane protein implicated in regulation of membrane protease activity